MLRTQRHSIIMIFLAFVVFGFPWLFFQAIIDPLSQWSPIALAHPEVDLLYRIAQSAGGIAFLMMLGALLPMLFVALKQALTSLRCDILSLITLCTLMTLIFTGATFLVITGYWGKDFDPNGGIYAIIGLLFVGTVMLTLSLALLRSELSERVLLLALWSTVFVIGAMFIALIAISIDSLLLARYASHVFGNGTGMEIGNTVMAAAIVWAIIALWRGFRARLPAAG